MASPPRPPPPGKSLLLSVVRLSRLLSSSKRPKSVLQKRNIASVVRNSHLLSVLFVFDVDDAFPLHGILCLREILTVLRRFESLLHTCLVRSSLMRLLLQSSSVSDEFRQLTRDLSTLVDMFPWVEVDISDDVRDFVHLFQRQCRRSDNNTDPAEKELLSEIREMLDEIEREIVPQRSRLEAMFKKLGLSDSERCKDEIVKLETEIREGVGGSGTVTLVSLLGLVRYAKCVLFGASTSRCYREAGIDDTGKFTRSISFSAVSVPDDFRCPISLELMRDPVVVESGQTYDRESIGKWIDSGHATCPKTGQELSDLFLIPNFALKRLIALWCRDQNLPVRLKETSSPSSSSSSSSTSQIKGGLSFSKAALEAARMTALFLVDELSTSNSTEAVNRIVHELRELSKTGSESRLFIADAGAIPLLLPLLNSSDPNLQVNAVTALLNLSILEDNKKRILNTQGGLEGVVGVLRFGATWCARENAAATLLSLSSLHSVYRKRVGGEDGVVEGLTELVRSGPISSKSDGLIAILKLAGMRENMDRLVEGGVVSTVLEVVRENNVTEMAVAVLAAVAKRGGAKTISVVDGFVEKMVWVLREGTDSAKESAASALVYVCKLGGNSKPMEELAKAPGIEWVVWGMMISRSARARRKATALGRICRRWAVAQETTVTITSAANSESNSFGVLAAESS